ncbi:cell division-associated protein bimb [Metarhizium album ARSEF 1941]|uniref:separase n=1 Tax=Metarhizium album (strain ARSEF 1941) TaxID=1081103 RepID=A0A0B2WWV3_METAS|nr:cell division-associated protein bimb [Metarhizium album ARSEF 1941]KHO00697.1 cell division-associated protein bimb [Metarhizium album ARSEF 1941]
MASLQASADAVKAAVSSTTTCTPATVVTLKELLLLGTESSAQLTKSASGTERTATTAKSSKVSTVSRRKPPAAQSRHEQLNSRDRTILATHVVNAALKALAEAARPAPPPTPCKQVENGPRTASKRTLRRSLSAPLSPMQPRTLNRVATSPNIPTAKAKAGVSAHPTGCLAIVECARVAFASLRLLKPSTQEPQYDFQVENGMSAFIGKLLALKMHDQALKEMRILKSRLDPATATESSKHPKSTPVENKASAAGIAELLEFRTRASLSALPIIASFQIQILKLIGATKKPAHIEALLPMLLETNTSCPVNLLSKLAEAGEKQTQKAARQMASLSQTLLSMLPSVSSQEDEVAVEPRLSPSPQSVFELQALAFRTQLRWWKLAGHQGSIDDEVLAPFSRCMRALARRNAPDDKLLYQSLVAAYEELMQLVRSHQLDPSTSSRSPLSSIYQVLGCAAHAARQYDDACRWFERLKSTLGSGSDSAVALCSVSARMLAAALKKPELDSDIEKATREVIDSLDGSLSGTLTELNELLESLSATRRSVVGLLMKELDPKVVSDPMPETTSTLLKTFVLRYPRFLRRWMGAAPGRDAPAKQTLQFEQRRRAVLQSINQTLDATLMVVRCEIQSGALEWHQIDDVLQHCSGLLDSLCDPLLSPGRAEQLGGYHVKISTLYFSKFTELRKMKNRTKDLGKQLLQSLSRSIDAVKERSPAQKEKAQLSMKLELFADLCKGSGRSEDAVATLRSICTAMVEDGVLSDVAAALASLPPTVAWAATDKASSLSRTLRSIAKLDKSWNDWTFFLPEAERAAVLEHLMHLSTDSAGHGLPLGLHDASPTALLRIYSLDKYPIRRFRVLLHLLHQNIGEDEELAEIKSSLDQVSRHLQKKDKGEDGSLTQFIPHLQAYHSSLAALADSDDGLPVSVIKDSIACWRAILGSYGSKDDLHTKIDNPQMLIDFLQTLNHLADLRGETELQISISELSIAMTEAVGEYSGSFHEGLILHNSRLATQYLGVGKFAQASGALDISKELLEHNEGVSQRVVADFYLSQAEYYAGVGNLDEASVCVDKANDICCQSHSLWAQSKYQANLMLSLSALIRSTVSLQTGNIEDALSSIRTGVRVLSHDWAKLEATSSTPDANTPEGSLTGLDLRPSKAKRTGPRFWGLAAPLLRCLLHISSVYSHIGMFQETIYYAESAWKIAQSTQSSLYYAQVAAWTGSVYLKAGNMAKAIDTLADAKLRIPSSICSSRVHFARKLGELYSEIGDDDKANEYLTIAEETLRWMDHAAPGDLGRCDKPTEPAAMAKSTASKTTRIRRPARGKPECVTRPLGRPARAKAQAVRSEAAAQLPKDVYQSSLLAAVLLSRAVGYIRKKDWSSALSALGQAKELPKLLETLSLEQVVTATSLIGHSMEQMISDPVFSVMQDSTISFPAIASSAARASTDKSSLVASPPRRGRAAAGDRKTAKDKAGPAFADALRRAQDILMEAHGSALSTYDSSMVHRLSALLQNTIILLSATSAPKTRPILSCGLATVAVDLGRNITWAREQATLAASPRPSVPGDSPSSPRRAVVGLSPSMAAFQRDYVDSLPDGWNVISLSLSDGRHDLCITKLQAGHSPFILRLPLERAHSRDADAEVFNFEHGREELVDIVKLANETSHSARDFSAKGERSAWWAGRQELDTRLKHLLSTVESTWLGGFKGIFSQHRRRADLSARFHERFQQILDGSLPSRSRMRGKKTPKAPSVNLDPRILDLFIGLGDPTGPECDLDEALNDLLYFVVDILQFHGERNAYDEIDFDAMVVETCDALGGYYSALNSGPERQDGSHTILVLDKALHAFPWESLPCMEGLALSRVPSLACLRRLIAESDRQRCRSGLPEGHRVSPKAGTYILNPSSDLKNTQAFFQPAFETLESWDAIVNKSPQESEFQDALSESDIMLYFGHGSGAQYIRGKTVRRLDKCRATTFLMGCSSAALTEAGGFECYGPVWNYMMAGCPAVVGTLWDVTDGDIDRFAGRAFEEWGLFAHGTFEKGGGNKGRCKKHVVDDVGADGGRDCINQETRSHTRSLPEAVARARGACKFKYLNAAAVVVYGIPVYISREG